MEYDWICRRTKRLVLRPVELADAADLFEAYGDFDAVYGMDVQRAFDNIDDLLDYMQKQLLCLGDDIPPAMVLELQKTGKVIGIIQFHHRKNGIGEIGYHLSRAYWHMGYMSEALMAMLDIGFTLLQLERIEARYTPKNVASANVLRRCHFVKEGYLRKAVMLNDGRLHDVVVCSVLKEEYRKQEDIYEKRTRSEI